MNKYILEPIKARELHAGTKAREDINFFLGNAEYKAILFSANNSQKFLFKVKNYAMCILRLERIFSGIERKSIILIQYPLFTNPIVLEYIIRKSASKGIKLVALIHDIDALRFERDAQHIKQEIGYLNSFDYVISHNPSMTEWMTKNGFSNNVLDLEMFDYKMNWNENRSDCAPFDKERTVVFAGNLTKNKSKFLYSLNDDMLNGLKLNLYGIEYEESEMNCTRVCYKGAHQPDELPGKLEGHFGLIWDGNEITTCAGCYGQYLRFNNPHKLSLYIAAGMPIVTWRKSAISNIISKNKIGILVDSLTEVSETIAEVTNTQYMEMRTNVESFREKVSSGYFIQSAIQRIEESFNKEKENAI